VTAQKRETKCSCEPLSVKKEITLGVSSSMVGDALGRAIEEEGDPIIRLEGASRRTTVDKKKNDRRFIITGPSRWPRRKIEREELRRGGRKKDSLSY